MISIMRLRTKNIVSDKEEETDHNEETRVGVDHLGLVAGLQVPEDRRIIEEGQVDHVLALLKFGWVDSTNIPCLEREPAYIM